MPSIGQYRGLKQKNHTRVLFEQEEISVELVGSLCLTYKDLKRMKHESNEIRESS